MKHHVNVNVYTLNLTKAGMANDTQFGGTETIGSDTEESSGRGGGGIMVKSR